MNPTVIFIGWQPCSNPALAFPMFNVFGHSEIANGGTVSLDTLKKFALTVPQYPEAN